MFPHQCQDNSLQPLYLLRFGHSLPRPHSLRRSPSPFRFPFGADAPVPCKQNSRLQRTQYCYRHSQMMPDCVKSTFSPHRSNTVKSFLSASSFAPMEEVRTLPIGTLRISTLAGIKTPVRSRETLQGLPSLCLNSSLIRGLGG